MTAQNNISRREYTAADMNQIDSAERQLSADHPEIAKDPRIADKIDDFFQTNRQTPVTLENTYRALGLSSAEARWYQVAHDNFDRARQLVAVYQTQRQWVHSGDGLFENLLSLFSRLHGYEINSVTIQHAADRIAHAPGKQLYRILQPRRTEPKSPAAKAAEQNRTGEYKPGQFIDPIHEPEWVKRSRERSEREAREAAANPSDATLRSRAAAEAKNRAEQLRGATHSENEQLQAIFITVPGTSEIDWPSTLVSRERMQAQFRRHREVSRFIR